MSDNKQEVIFQHFKKNVWLRRFAAVKKTHMDPVSVCIQLEDKSFVNLGFLHFCDGIFYLKGESIGTIDDTSFLNYIEKITGIKKSENKDDKIPYEKSDDFFEKVCEEYKYTNSIKQTAKKLGISEEKTKRILITAGLYTSRKYQEIKELLEKGKTVNEIAEQLQMSKKQIRIFLPYNDKL